MTFDQFDLDRRLLQTLKAQRIHHPTPVQHQAIPLVLEGSDLVAVAQTGTGKTLAFALPTLTRVAQESPERNRILVLVPTRELCVQVEKVYRELGKAAGVKSVQIYGGVSFDQQAKELRKGATVIVATPGRLLDHMSRGRLQLDGLEVLVLDEADRMLDMGFLPDLQRIVRQLPQDRQTLMFSATFPPEIEKLAAKMLQNPKRVSVGAVAKPVEKVRQELYPVMQEDKSRLLLDLLDEEDVTSALIFLRTKVRTERLAAVLKKKGVKIAQIHGDRSQGQRQRALDGFRSGKYKFLVATDVAARGLDIEGVSHVINYDIPLDPDDYIHRIGRTARAEAEGDAITFVSPEEYKALESLERSLGYNIPRMEWEDAPPMLTLYKPAAAKATKASGGRNVRRTPGGRRIANRRR